MMTDLLRLRRPYRKSRGGFPDHRCDFPALELGFEISEREKSHAWECAACRDLAAHELLREQDRGHAGNLGAVIGVRRELPFDARAAAVVARAKHANDHAAPLAAEPIQGVGKPAQCEHPALE